MVGPAFEPAARNNKNVLGQKKEKKKRKDLALIGIASRNRIHGKAKGIQTDKN